MDCIPINTHTLHVDTLLFCETDGPVSVWTIQR